MFRKLACLFLALLMLTTSVPLNVFAAKTTQTTATNSTTDVKYNKLKDISLYQGRTQTLSVTDSSDAPVKGVKWKSSNTKVAKITTSSGKLTAVAPGTATITATVNGVKLTCKVTVKKMKISATSKTLTQDDTYTLKVYGGKGDITWKSSNSKIAKVSSTGKVTAVKPGTATITAKRDGKTFTCKITVLGYPEEGITKTKKIHIDDYAFSETYKFTLTGKSVVTFTGVVNSGDESLYLSLWAPDLSDEFTAYIKAGEPFTKKLTLPAGEYTLYYDASRVDADITIETLIKPHIYSKSAKAKYVAKGYSLQLRLAGVKNGGTWSSSNKSIATVSSDGLVKGKKTGECTIYCKLKDGTKLSYKIKVVNPVTLKTTYVDNTSIYNEAGIKFTNYTSKTVEYVEFQIYQYDYKGRRLKSPYDWFYCDYSIPKRSDLTLEYWVNDNTKTCKLKVLEVKFTDGSYWKP